MAKGSNPISVTELMEFGGGLRCDLPSHVIEMTQLSDIQNFDVDIPGKLTTRKGYQKIASAGIGAAPVRGLFEHIETNGAKNVIAACNGRLWRLNERLGTWSEIHQDSCPSIYGPNLITNGSFATDTTGWTLNNSGTNTTVARDATHGPAGTPCLKIATTTPTELLTDPTMANYHRGTPPVANDTTWTSWTAIRNNGSAFYTDGGTAFGIPYLGFTVNHTGTANEFLHQDNISISTLENYRIYSEIGGMVRGASGKVLAHIYDSGGNNLYPMPSVTQAWDTPQSWVPISVTFDGSAYPTLNHATFYLNCNGVATNAGDIGYFRYPSFTARPRFNDTPLSTAAAIHPSYRRKVIFQIARMSTADYSNMSLSVYAHYYSDSGATTQIGDKVLLTTPTTTPTFSTITIERPVNAAPSNAIRVRYSFEATGYFDGYDATAANQGWYITGLETEEIDDSVPIITPLVITDDNPGFLSFMGNLYIFGSDQNIKLTNAKASEFLPEYPMNCSFGIVKNYRMFLAGNHDNPSRLYFTNYTAGNEVDPDMIDPTTGFIDVAPDDGDEITGIAPCGAGVVIFKHHSTYMLTGSSAADWFLRQASSAVGCASHRTICAHQSTVIFLDENNPGVFMFDGSVNFTLLSRNIDPLIGRIVNPSKASAIIWKERYCLFCDDQNAVDPYNETVYVYSLKTSAWTRYSGICADSVCMRSDGSLLFGSAANDGMAYKLFEGYDDDGTAIEAYFETGDIEFAGDAVQNKIRKISTVAESGTDTQEIDISYAANRSSLMLDAPLPFMLTATGTNKWGVAQWDTDEWEEKQMLRNTFNPNASRARQIRIKCSHTDTEPATIYGFVVLYRERKVKN